MQARMGNLGSVAMMLLALALFTLSMAGCSQGTFAAGNDTPEGSTANTRGLPAGPGSAPGRPDPATAALWAGKPRGSLSAGDSVGSATVRFEGYLSDEEDEQP